MSTPRTGPDGAPVRSFRGSTEWRRWIEDNHATSAGVWIRIAKAGSGLRSVSHADALDDALRFGWIDARRVRGDDGFFLQKFTPRRPGSLWSRINREKAESFIRDGSITPAGLAAVHEAKRNGRWDAAYESQARATVPDDLAAAFRKDPGARAFFETLDSRNRYAVLHRIQIAKKPETRARRIETFVAMLARHEKLHP